MKEELTTKMHEELSVTNETDVRHKVGSVVTIMNLMKDKELQDILKSYGVTKDDYDRWKDYWE